MDRKEYMKNWRLNNRYNRKIYWKKWYSQLRKKAMIILGRGTIKCERCGYDNYEELQINHKNGGGRKEYHGYNNARYMFYRDIVNGSRRIDDLNVLCRACNFVDLAERIGGEDYKVTVERTVSKNQ